MRAIRGATSRTRSASRKGLAVGLLFLALVVVIGCDTEEGAAGADDEQLGSTPSTPPPPEQGVVYLFARSPTSISPPSAVTPDDVAIVDQVFEPLTRVDAALELRPAAAVSWEVSEDAMVHTFRLRRGANFHDGSPVTAASFIRAWERVADRTVDDPSPAHHLLDLVVGIDEAREGGELRGAVALDDRTLEVTLREPYADLPALVSHPSLVPLPPSSGVVSDFDRMPIGNGPLRMAEPWHPGQVIRLEPFLDHPRAPNAVRQVVFRLYDGDEAEATAYEDLRMGRLDLAPVPTAHVDDARAEFGRAQRGRIAPGLIDGPRQTTVFLAFNVDVAPYDDADLRRAIASLVDRSVIGPRIDAAWVPLESVVPPDVIAGYEPPACVYCAVDLPRARDLLRDPDEAEAEGAEEDADGGEDADDAVAPTYELELTYPQDDRYEAIAGELAEAFMGLDAGVSLELRALSQDEWLSAVREGEAGMFLSGWSAEYPTPGAYLDHLFHPSRRGTDNLTRFDHDEVTELLDAARGALEPEERFALYREAEAIVLDEMPVIPLHSYRHMQVASERLSGAVIDPSGRIDLSRLDPVGPAAER